MANICTTFVRIVWRAPDRGGVDEAALAAAALGERESYGMPLRLEQVPAPLAAPLVTPSAAGFTDLEYGMRGSPGLGPAELWSLVAGAADSLWVRWFDDGGDWDIIEMLDAVGRTPIRLCRYGFDAVRSGGETIAIAGSYLIGSDRSFLDVPRRRAAPGRVAPAAAVGLASAPDAELLWSGRVVHRGTESSAGWDSCVDPDFRAAFGLPDWVDAAVIDEDARRWTRG